MRYLVTSVPSPPPNPKGTHPWEKEDEWGAEDKKKPKSGVDHRSQGNKDSGI